jgi:hypothetical protein
LLSISFISKSSIMTRLPHGPNSILTEALETGPWTECKNLIRQVMTTGYGWLRINCLYTLSPPEMSTREPIWWLMRLQVIQSRSHWSQMVWR